MLKSFTISCMGLLCFNFVRFHKNLNLGFTLNPSTTAKNIGKDWILDIRQNHKICANNFNTLTKL